MRGPPKRESPGAGDTATRANQNFHPKDIFPNDRICKPVAIDDLADLILARLVGDQVRAA